MNGTLMVASYWTAVEMAPAFDPQYVLSLMDPGVSYEVPAGPHLEYHLRIEVTDIDNDGAPVPPPYLAPSVAHVERIIDAARTWDRRGNVLVHCMGGASRSPAAALVLLTAIHPSRASEIAQMLRLRGPWLSPNRAIVRIGDRLLGLDGDLMRALDQMGEPTDRRGQSGPVFISMGV